MGKKQVGGTGCAQVVVICLVLLLSSAVFNTAEAAEPADSVKLEQIDATVARLSDEQVRRLLLQELQKAASAAVSEDSESGGLLSRYEAFCIVANKRIKAVFSKAHTLPADFAIGVQQMSSRQGKTYSQMFFTAIFGLTCLLIGFGVEKFCLNRGSGLMRHIETATTEHGLGRVPRGFVLIVPNLLGLFVFAISSLFLFLVFFGDNRITVELFFMPTLAALIIGRLSALLSRRIFAPHAPERRMVLLSDRKASGLDRLTRSAVWTATIVAIIIDKLRGLVAYPDSGVLIQFGFGTVFLVLFVLYLLRFRPELNTSSSPGEHSAKSYDDFSPSAPNLPKRSFIAEQLATHWHFWAIFYLVVIWGLWATRLIVYDPPHDSAFILSLLIVPIYLLLTRLFDWAVGLTIDILGIGAESQTGDTFASEPSTSSARTDPEGDTEAQDSITTPDSQRIHGTARRLSRVVIVLALCVFILDAWGLEVSVGRNLFDGLFDIIVTLAVALLLWRALSRYIARKLKDEEPEPTEEDEGDEWGGQALGRGYTLLPMLRKGLGVILFTLVTMIILSEIGVDIGPLLAGAGVVGLAVGFGAQKLVADIFSGIFYLVDDAFRVGEYIQAGSVSGSVEAITMRNVMLRHHRGMLQIVPLSDLGSITNYMRGGMVIKFNIHLPYGTNIEKVRKIIKKVGKKMMADPELGPSLIKQVKTQGVREAADSVMTFRIKFTAIAGKHFLIRREAFRRITEALAAKGIYYAHRKVIVEVPGLNDDSDNNAKPAATPLSPGKKREIIEAGAAAAMDTVVQSEQTGAKPK